KEHDDRGQLDEERVISDGMMRKDHQHLARQKNRRKVEGKFEPEQFSPVHGSAENFPEIHSFGADAREDKSQSDRSDEENIEQQHDHIGNCLQKGQWLPQIDLSNAGNKRHDQDRDNRKVNPLAGFTEKLPELLFD